MKSMKTAPTSAVPPLPPAGPGIRAGGGGGSNAHDTSVVAPGETVPLSGAILKYPFSFASSLSST